MVKADTRAEGNAEWVCGCLISWNVGFVEVRRVFVPRLFDVLMCWMFGMLERVC